MRIYIEVTPVNCKLMEAKAKKLLLDKIQCYEAWILAIFGQYRSRDLHTGLRLVNTGHVSQLLASDWSYLKCLFPPLKLPPLKLPDPKSGLLLIPLFNGFHLGVARETVTIAARSWNYHLMINYYLHFFFKNLCYYQKTLHAVYCVNYETVFERLMLLRVSPRVLYLAFVNIREKEQGPITVQYSGSGPITARAGLRVPSVPR